MSSEERRRVTMAEFERVKAALEQRKRDGDDLTLEEEIGKKWPVTLRCSCGRVSRLQGARFATVAVYRCDECKAEVKRMVC